MFVVAPALAVASPLCVAACRSPAQHPVQCAAQPRRPQNELTTLIPGWALVQRPSSTTPAQQALTDIEDAHVSATALHEDQERRKRSANVVTYGLSGDSSAHLRQSALEVVRALN